ncbi:HK97 family phage prohead protease [Maricaulis sp.]|uniref:HK97 family phage prohead protease n=1 Tax=Maricaulis sp. TaxID=1486257 RepID=UPI0025C50F7F|nr:HK97 family phage prohead protease [Maricaulis sp.]
MSSLAIEGYASLFNLEDLSGDIVLPGAFADGLAGGRTAGRNVPMLYQHEPTEPVGRWQIIRQDRKGLWVEGEIVDASEQSRSVQALVRRGALNGLSIGFRTRSSRPRPSRGRFLEAIELWEVSIVTFPMLPQARLSLAASDRRAA